VELLATAADGSKRAVKAEEALEGKTVGIYFSAHWWAQCRPAGFDAACHSV